MTPRSPSRQALERRIAQAARQEAAARQRPGWELVAELYARLGRDLEALRRQAQR